MHDLIRDASYSIWPIKLQYGSHIVSLTSALPYCISLLVFSSTMQQMVCNMLQKVPN